LLIEIKCGNRQNPKKEKTRPQQDVADLMQTIREFDRSAPERFTKELEPIKKSRKGNL